MLYRKWIKLAAILTLITLLSAGCGLFGPKESQPIDPPQAQDGAGADGTVATTAGNGVDVTLYLFDEKHNVTPTTLSLPDTESIGKEALEFLVKGGVSEGLLPTGFSGVLPEGTKILGLNVKKDEKLAIVDFSKEFKNYEAKDEERMLQAITWTLTEFPTVDKVKLRVEHKDLEIMPVAKTPVDQGLTRAAGINLEASETTNIGNTMPVTVYFQGTNTAGDYSYYVPVTRLVPRSDDVAQTVLNQLIQGPKEGSNLASTLLPSTKLLKVSMTGDKITANFDKTLLGLGGGKQVSSQTVDSIVLSLTENIPSAKVQIMVDGDAKVMMDKTSLEKPVSRPTEINRYKF